ncbi:MAG: hypothetical protein PWQ81_301 [Bacteroidota bacterium]|jgi:hypothetical protein|nr:hypothetical protein [Bacteroidota bacterium]OPZ11807.1 MAG: hypothetical protein BWZ06_01635 [Bacteroidetes bacterium ADurb.BinA261]PLB87326.1 hypothetical protein C0T31_00070 [Dysgonamonadaceae bacterium]MDK2969097.1 hypothetical protein [Bacteroidota bacterium]MDN5297047.1 hypothetical protein [Bacteroidota bacterium]
MEKQTVKESISSPSAFYREPHWWNKTKLLITGFECLAIFVIRRSDQSEYPKARPAIDNENLSRSLEYY